jgi:exosortase/archaeosortase family protein
VLCCFRASLTSYARDSFYQSHFVFLWAFFGAAIVKAGCGAARATIVWEGKRTLAAAGLLLAAIVVYRASIVTGSSTAERVALTGAFGGAALLALPQWSVRRCLAYFAFALLCFGVPYSLYQQVTLLFRASFMAVLAALPQVTPLAYEVDGLSLRFPHYRLEITEDCSGFNQLVTFLGLAFLGSLTGAPRLRRAAALFAAGAALAYLANLTRVLSFVALVGLEWVAAVEHPILHTAVGIAAFAPFVLLFLALVLRTHSPRGAAPRAGRTGGSRLPLVAMLLPFVLLRACHEELPLPQDNAVAYMAGLEAPPATRWQPGRAAKARSARRTRPTTS